MSRVHDSLKQKKAGRRPVRARQSAVPSVLVTDAQRVEPAAGEAPDALRAIRETEAKLKEGIAALQQENARLRAENSALRTRTQGDAGA